MVDFRRGPRSVVSRLTSVLLPTAAMMAMAVTAWAESGTYTWTTKGDFENNAVTLGRPTNRTNIDTTTLPDSVRMGFNKDFVTNATATAVTPNKIYTTGVDRVSIAVIDSATKTLLTTIPLEGRPAGAVYNPTNQKLYVGQYDSNKLYIINTADDTASSITLEGGNGTYASVYNAIQNKVYIARPGDEKVTILDGVSNDTLATVNVVPGATTGTHDATNNAVYVTSKANEFVTAIAGDTNSVNGIQVAPVLNLIGGQIPGNVGLRVVDPAMENAGVLKLSWNYQPLEANQKIEFQVRTAVDEASLDAARYQGPGQSESAWYDVVTPGAVITDETDGTVTASVTLDAAADRAAEIQVRLGSNGVGTPVVHSVTLSYESNPDLVSSISGPADGTIGSTITVSTTVTNNGAGTAPASTVGFALGSDALAEKMSVPSLAAGASYTAETVLTIPATVKSGTYQLTATADDGNLVAETDENNNSSSYSIVMYSPAADLMVTNVQGTIIAGGKISVIVSIKNMGRENAYLNHTGMYLSADNVIGDGNDTQLADLVTGISYLGWNLSTDVTYSPLLPKDYIGTWYVGGWADHLNQTVELDDNNNKLAGNQVTIVNDLIVVPDSLTGSVIYSYGNKLTYSVKIRNTGNGRASTNKTGIYLSSDNVIEPLTDKRVEGLTSGTSTLYGTVEATISRTNVPFTGLAPGTYYLGACADYEGNTPEGDYENNNCSVGPTVIVQ